MNKIGNSCVMPTFVVLGVKVFQTGQDFRICNIFCTNGMLTE